MNIPNNKRRIVIILIGVVVLTQLVALVLSHRVHNDIARDTVAESLQAARLFFDQAMQTTNTQQLRAASVLAEDFGLRSAVSLADQVTTESMLRNHQQRIRSSFIAILEPDGHLQASTDPLATDVDWILEGIFERARANEQSAEIWQQGDRLYRLVVVPVRAPILVAWLVVGVEIDDTEAKRLANLIGIEVTFVAAPQDGDETIVASTLSPAARSSVEQTHWQTASPKELREYVWNHEEFLVEVVPVGSDSNASPRALLATSIRTGLIPFEDLERRLFFLTLFSLTLALVGMGILIHRLVGPINELAYRDALTGLGNRALFEEKIGALVKFAAKEGRTLSLLFIDLDGFKQVNDEYGHDIGDEVLQEVATRLSAKVRNSDTVARLGGDEFVIVLDGADVAHALRVASMIALAFNESLEFGGQKINVGISMGIANTPLHTTREEELVRMADTAMYRAKQTGRDYCIYDAKT